MDDRNEKLKSYEAAVRHRVQCEERAFRIVNKLIDGAVEESYLIECGQLISREHYSDIVEERAISLLCGYPLCDKPLENIPKKKFHISTKSNKVYDISERKNFCSNQCLRASKHFQNQISESPVWARAKEPPVHLKILPLSDNKGFVGDEVVGTNPRKILEDEVSSLNNLPEKESSLAKSERSRVAPTSGKKPGTKPQEACTKSCDSSSERSEHVEKADEQNNRTSDTVSNSESVATKDNTSTTQLSQNLEQLTICDVVEKSDNLNQNNALTSTEGGKEESVVLGVPKTCSSNSVEKTSAPPQLNDASSGHDGSKKTAPPAYDSSKKSQAGIPSHAVQSSVSPSANRVSTDDKMQRLLELMARKKSVLSGMVEMQTVVVSKAPEQCKSPDQRKSHKENDQTTTPATKVAPDMKQKVTKKTKKSKSPSPLSPLTCIKNSLKRWISGATVEYLKTTDNKSPNATAELPGFSDPRVQAGYADLCHRLGAREKEMNAFVKETVDGDKAQTQGQNDVPKKLPDYKALKEEADAFQLKVSEFLTGKRAKDRAGAKENMEPNDVFIPTVDAYDQHQIRVRIVLDRLDKSLVELLGALRLTVQDVSGRLRELIYTFRFEKDTIVYKPWEWTLVAVFILKMLALKHPTISAAFAQESAIRFFKTLLEGIGHCEKDLDNQVKDLVSCRHEDL
ncbi:RNA polymerase II subunit B1 CTD phosphatase Rpap2 [Aplysia californica]|uniref:RNA polymerase II subunit B1 CTD phosphatase RPAP2 homolog n=1 Tax=Aplysia californica TaxID=6500 RepID=A0ABM1W3H3_APLCA|nr:RNA polymerase II subunit B1 CTD phosphatase Rpap2 [Aplysia californica]XP_035829216.1 RNA polymerase II subunit B1 CTD phosphatase Rpap2 [Aplysia californica]